MSELPYSKSQQPPCLLRALDWLECALRSAEVGLRGLDSLESALRSAEVGLRGLDSLESALGSAEVGLRGLDSSGDCPRNAEVDFRALDSDALTVWGLSLPTADRLRATKTSLRKSIFPLLNWFWPPTTYVPPHPPSSLGFTAI